jgi:hypothetical protein
MTAASAALARAGHAGSSEKGWAMPSWVIVSGTVIISLVSAYGFLMLRFRRTGNPFGRRARWWAIGVIVITAAVSTGVGMAAVAAGDHAIAAYVGLILPSGLWLGKASGQGGLRRSSTLPRLLVAVATLPLRRLYARMGEDMQDWCDTRLQAAARRPKWLSDAAQYYYSQVKGRLRDRQATDQLGRWRESIRHKVRMVGLIDLPATAGRLEAALHDHATTRDSRKYAVDDLPRLRRRLITEAENELHLFLALVYRLGYHRLLIYPFRPQTFPDDDPVLGGQPAERESAHPEPSAPDTSTL